MNGAGKGGGGIILLIVTILAAAGLVVSYILKPSLFKILIWVAIAAVVIVIIISVLLIYVANKSGGEKDENTAVGGVNENLSEEQNQILADARKELMGLRRVIMKIRGADVRGQANDVCGQLDSIIQTLREKPEKITDTRQCLNYYIPTIKGVLTRYEDLDKKAQLEDSTKEKMMSFLKDASSALTKQYNNLFEKDRLDMEVEMEAMTIGLKRDGLL